MPNISPLPESLRYLEPVRKQLAALGPDKIHEETDLSVLRRAVGKRIKGLTEKESRNALCDDTAELEKWLFTPTHQNEPLHFILPILPEAVDVLFTEPTLGPPERGVISMEVPDGAKVTEENGCWSVKWRRLYLGLYPSHEEDMRRTQGQFRDDAKRRPIVDGDGMSVTDVRFGNVVGIKRLSSQRSPRFKRLDYALEVPGGFVVAVLDSAKDFDESSLERFFHSLRVLNYQPPASVNS
jgi:hypothetical protein